jgi:hypothetical protein
MVNDNQVTGTSSSGAETGRAFSRMTLLLAFAGGAFAAWIIMQLV